MRGLIASGADDDAGCGVTQSGKSGFVQACAHCHAGGATPPYPCARRSVPPDRRVGVGIALDHSGFFPTTALMAVRMRGGLAMPTRLG
jgi:hypothetical protein